MKKTTIEKDKKRIKNKKDEFNNINLLNEIGNKKYNEIIKFLKDNKLYEDVDSTTVFLFSISYQDYIQTTIKLKEETEILVSDKGNSYINPRTNVRQMHLRTMQELSKQLFITVNGRAKQKNNNMLHENQSDMLDLLQLR